MPSGAITCPPWEYDKIDGCDALLFNRAKFTLMRVRAFTSHEKLAIAGDTRVLHRPYFEGLTPPGFEYYAGHYRGENFTCLRDRLVMILGDPRVGHHPHYVSGSMSTFVRDMRSAALQGDQIWTAPRALSSQPEKLLRVVQIVVALFVYFLEIHPYLNGNGHMARFILIALLGRYDVYPAKWPIHPRPHRDYGTLIEQYRSGNRTALERFVLQCL
jgi:fido (protein-threonine AMPylation protein)